MADEGERLAEDGERSGALHRPLTRQGTDAERAAGLGLDAAELQAEAVEVDE